MRRRKPSLRVGLPVLVIGIAMITIAYLNAGQYIQNGLPPPCFPQTCPALEYFVIVGLVGFFVAIWGAVQTIFGLLIRIGAFEYHSGPLEPPKPGSGPEDENILAMARDFQRQIRYPKFGETLPRRSGTQSLCWLSHSPTVGRSRWRRL